jgi:hypothetical protein
MWWEDLFFTASLLRVIEMCEEEQKTGFPIALLVDYPITTSIGWSTKCA